MLSGNAKSFTDSRYPTLFVSPDSYQSFIIVQTLASRIVHVVEADVDTSHVPLCLVLEVVRYTLAIAQALYDKVTLLWRP